MRLMSLLGILFVALPASAQDADTPSPEFSSAGRTYVGVNFSPDGQLLATSGPSFACIFETGRFRPRLEIRHRGLIDEVVFNPRGSVLVARGKSVDTVIWDTRTWKRIKAHPRPCASEMAMVFSQVRAYQFGRARGSCPAAYAPDGRWLALSNGRKGLRLWDMMGFTPRKAEIVEYPDYADGVLEHVNAILFSAPYLLVGEEGGYITPLPLRRWEKARSTEADGPDLIGLPGSSAGTPTVKRRDRPQFRRHRGHITSLSSTPDGRYCVSAGLDGKVRVWRQDQLQKAVRAVPEWEIPGCFAAVSTDGRLLATAEKKGIRLYALDLRKELGWFPADPRSGRIVRLRFNPARDQIAAICCACIECLPRRGVDLFPQSFNRRPERVHHHGGKLEIWDTSMLSRPKTP